MLLVDQFYFFICIRMCLLILLCTLNWRPHSFTGQTKGFSPVWEYVWILSDEGLLNDFWQTEQVYLKDGSSFLVIFSALFTAFKSNCFWHGAWGFVSIWGTIVEVADIVRLCLVTVGAGLISIKSERDLECVLGAGIESCCSSVGSALVLCLSSSSKNWMEGNDIWIESKKRRGRERERKNRNRVLKTIAGLIT